MKARSLASASLALLLPLSACHEPGSAISPHEQSVNPGINDSYKNVNVDDWVKRFESESREIYTEREHIVADTGVRPSMTIADIGAGTGFFSLMFAKTTGPRGKVYSVDITPEFLSHIKKLASAAGLDNVETVLCRADSVELPAQSVDLAFICDVYHHFEYPRSSMRSLYRALRPGAELVVIDFHRIKNVTRDWVMGHVRVGMATVTSEILSVGFELVSEDAPSAKLTENYFLRFRKPD